MALKDNLLANEEILFESEKHWISPIRGSVVPVLLIIGGILLGQIAPASGDGIVGFIGSITNWIQIGLIVVGAAMLVYNLVAWRTAEFAVSNLRVLREEGLISRRSSATLLQSVTDVKTKVPFLGQRLGYGDIVVVTQGGEQGVDRFANITQPEAFRDEIMARKVTDAGAPAAAAAPAPPAAPSPPPTSAVEPPPYAPGPDDMATLTRLAELRDSGVITGEEYEAKKAEILSRI